MLTGSEYTLEDLRRQCEWVPVPSRSLLNRLLVRMTPAEEAIVAQVLRQFRGIIDAMTPAERADPSLIGPGQQSRIAAGSGTEVHEVRALLQHFAQIRMRVRRLATLSLWERIKVELGWSRLPED
jgi:signal recognition particle GTPase